MLEDCYANTAKDAAAARLGVGPHAPQAAQATHHGLACVIVSSAATLVEIGRASCRERV